MIIFVLEGLKYFRTYFRRNSTFPRYIRICLHTTPSNLYFNVPFWLHFMIFEDFIILKWAIFLFDPFFFILSFPSDLIFFSSFPLTIISFLIARLWFSYPLAYSPDYKLIYLIIFAYLFSLLLTYPLPPIISIH